MPLPGVQISSSPPVFLSEPTNESEWLLGLKLSGIRTQEDSKIKKQTPKAIIYCIVVFILGFFLSLMAAFIAGISGPSPGERIHGPSIIRLPFILSPLFFLIAIVGTLRGKRYGRILSLIVAVIVSITMFYISWSSLFSVMIKENYIFAIMEVFIGLAFLGVIHCLNKPNVKGYFNQRPANS